MADQASASGSAPSASEQAPGIPVIVTTDPAAGLIEFAVHSTWGPRLHASVSVRLRRCLAQHPAALIIDLRDLADSDGTSAAVWWTARLRAADMEPPVRVVVCAPAAAPVAARLRRLGSRLALPLYETMPEARAVASSGRPLTQHLRLRLPPTMQAPAFARGLVDDACAAWSMPGLLFRAKLVATELVLNAVEHARTESRLTVTRRGDGIHLAVADLDPRLPRMPPARAATPADHRDTGLRAVRAHATVAGVRPTRTGKMVWAVLQPARREQ
jgi:hypothetical protein